MITILEKFCTELERGGGVEGGVGVKAITRTASAVKNQLMNQSKKHLKINKNKFLPQKPFKQGEMLLKYLRN